MVLGTVTLPPRSDTLATKVLTTILCSLTKDFKQVVAYDFTGPSVSGKDLWAYIKATIAACGKHGIQVVVVVRSDFSLYHHTLYEQISEWHCKSFILSFAIKMMSMFLPSISNF